jgi:uncharacterized protein YegL
VNLPRRASSLAFVLATLGSLASVGACSSATKGTGFTDDSPSTAGKSPSGTSSGGGGGDSPTLGGTDTDGGASGGDPDAAACATASAQAEELPVYLVFMFDRSGSMKFNPSPNNKWDACVAGLDTFFGDAQSKGLYASMQVFPYDNGECSSATYQTPLVAATALPDTTSAFKNALAQNGPDPNYGTPTLPALQGALGYAKQLQSGFTHGERVAVVLVTDGDPNDCGSSAANVGQEASKTASTIPTYVIGVGSSLSNLNTIAKGGGTSAALLVDTSKPQQITADFIKAVSQIRSAALTCEYKIPAAPAGQTLDPNKVNVVYTPGGGAAQTLSYNKDCTGNGQGWRYDDASAPTKIEVCAASCDGLKGGAGRVDVVLGCATQGGVTR